MYYSMNGIPVHSGVGGDVIDGCELGVSRGVESPMRGKVPGEMENSYSFEVCVQQGTLHS